MKHRIDKWIKTAVCIIFVISLSGCWNNRELDTLGIVMGVGVDKSEGPGRIQLTVQVVKPGEISSSKKSGNSGGSSAAFWNVTGTGDTIFSTIRDLTNQSSRKLFFPHNQVLIFGRSLAEEGLQGYVDFFARDPETRLNIWILVSEGSAAEILSVKSELEKIPANNISKLVKGKNTSASQGPSVRFRDLITRLMSKTTAPVAPMIKITGEGEEKAVELSGTAVFKKDKMVGVMDKTEGRGLLWVLGEVEGGTIEVQENESIISMEVVRASAEITPEFSDGKIKIKVDITEEGNLAEETGTQNLSGLGEITSLENKKADVIRGEVMAALRKAQGLDADVFAFGDAVHQHYPKEWKDLEGKWDEIFPTIEVQVNVQSKLRLMGRISSPTVPE